MKFKYIKHLGSRYLVQSLKFLSVLYGREIRCAIS